MINGYKILKDRYADFDQDSRTPNGIDLRVGAVYGLGGSGYMIGLMEDEKVLPPHIEIPMDEVENSHGTVSGWVLHPHVPYILEVADEISIDSDSMQTYYPRSTLLRSGCTLHTAVGDAGYNGKLAFLFLNHTENPFFMEKGVRFAQLVDHQVTGASIQYDGDYQNDKHKEKDI